MTLYHITPDANEPSIRVWGLLASRAANGKLWLVSQSEIEWAIGHVMARHQCARVAIYEVRVRRSHLRKQTIRGHAFAWNSRTDYPPCKVTLLAFRSK